MRSPFVSVYQRGFYNAFVISPRGRAPGAGTMIPGADRNARLDSIWRRRRSVLGQGAQIPRAPEESDANPHRFDSKGDVTKADFVFYVWHNGSYKEM